MNKDPKLAIVFPGQGSQTIGMLDNLITIDKKAREIVNIASDILGYDILKIISDGPKEKLDSTEVTQPAILLTSYVTWLLWKHESNAIPSVLAGHSLGEYTALLCADIISFEDAIMIVSERGKYMQQSVPDSTGAMAAILGLDDSLIEQLCSNAAEDEIVSAANYNSPGQVVVSGHKNAVNRMINLAKNAGARRAILLPISVPSHCALMKDTANKFSKLLDKITFNNAQIPILQNVDAKLKTNAADIKTALIKQLYEPVRWVDTINEIHRIGVTKIIECGPNNVLSGLIKRIEKSFELFSISDRPSLDKTLI
ncbi:MAG: [acyl-carrier-protein] S-malonyltransferase [Legionellales bacterium]|nr:[acyl-carrier-protein] S-malonyltransferase [Legionellales bacterium]